MRRSIFLGALASAALVCAACGSSRSPGVGARSPSPPPPSTTTTSPPPVVITESTAGQTQVPVAGTVEVELTSSSYSRDGQLVPWMAPASSSPGVLVRSGMKSPAACPADATCSLFVGIGPGAAVLSTVGPSGILCTAARTRCIAVAPVIRRFVVEVIGG